MARLLLSLAALLAAAAPAHAASGTLLDPIKLKLKAGAASRGACDAPALPARKLARLAYTPRISGYLTVRSTVTRGDWDLAAYDRPSGRLVAASQSFGSREVVQLWVQAGRAVTIVGCRHSGARSLPLSAQLFVADLPHSEPAALVRVSGLDRAGFARLEATGVDVTHDVDGASAQVIATAADVARLKAAGFDVTTTIADLSAYERDARSADARYAKRVGGVSPLPSGRTTYRTFEDIQAELKDLVAKHPGLVRAIKLPKPSFQGRELSGVEIAKDVDAADGRPQFLLVATHHAREWPAEEAAMEFAHLLAESSDPRVQQILASTRTVIVPLINPDGFVSSRTMAVADPSNTLYDNGVDVPAPLCGNLNTCEGVAPPGGILSFRRKNCDGAIPSGSVPCELQYGVDPNRNYGQFWGGAGSSPDPTSQSYRGPGPWSEPETQAVHEWSQSHDVTTLITLHNVAALVLRPPGVQDQGEAPDEVAMKDLGDKMAAATGYKSQYGYQLYDTSGTTEDWNYAAAGTFGYTIEMGPDGGEFHMPYETGVVKEWTGTGEREGKGMREALLLAAESSYQPAYVSTLTGRAPAGRTLHLHKNFTTTTKEACGEAVTGAPFDAGKEVCVGGTIAAQQIADRLDYTTVVPASGHYEWLITPSTRPFIAKAGGTESWTLTCEQDGKAIETREVKIARGEKLSLDIPCGTTLPALPVAKTPAAKKPKKKASEPAVCKKARRAHGKQKRKLAKRCKAAKRRKH